MRRMRWLCAVAFLALLAGCGGDGPQEAQALRGGPGGSFDGAAAPGLNPEAAPVAAQPAVDRECVSNEAFFLEKVWAPVLSSRCFDCHNQLGAAKTSDLVFKDVDQVGAMDHNLEVFAELATLEREGVSVLLLKPSGQVDHGGGTQVEVGSPEYQALESMLARLESPVDCEEDAVLDDGFFAGVELLDPQRTLRKVSLSIAGRLPSADEVQAVDQHGLEALEAIMDRLLREEGFMEIFFEIWGDILMTDKYIGGNRASQLLNINRYPNARWYYDDGYDRSSEDPRFSSLASLYSNDAIAREPMQLIRYILENDRPFTEILTADYMVLNPYTAKIYGAENPQWVNPMDPNEYQALDVPGLPHAGLLTSPMVLNRWPTTDTNRNRHRAAKVFDIFLDTDILELGQRPIDPTSTVHNPTLNDPQCTSCHAVLDPLAGAFQNWDFQGSYVPVDSWFEGMLAPGFGDEEVAHEDKAQSLNWLARRIVSDERFPRAMTRVVFRGLTGHEPLSLPSEQTPNREAHLRAYEAQQSFFEAVGKDFIVNGADIRRMIKSIVRSHWFRADSYGVAMDETRREELGLLGVGRRLTPEMVSRRIEAVFGYPWKAAVNSADPLLDVSQYRILYGGLDFNDVTERLDTPNGVMSAIQQLMANDLACKNVARDFVAQQSQRTLFPMVEATYVPEDGNGFDVPMAIEAIRRNIQYLHRHVLGESLELDDPEIDRTYDLFYETWKEGRAKVLARDLPASIHYSCQGRVDFWTGEAFPVAERVAADGLYAVRAWSAVVSYLLMDYRFLYD